MALQHVGGEFHGIGLGEVAQLFDLFDFFRTEIIGLQRFGFLHDKLQVHFLCGFIREIDDHFLSRKLQETTLPAPQDLLIR